MNHVFSILYRAGPSRMWAGRHSRRQNKKEECNECWAKYYCSGGCAANSIFFAGGITKPYKIGCELMRKRVECALAIAAIENANKSL